jgi:hypothetical protein
MESVSIIKAAARLSAGQGTVCPARASAQLGTFLKRGVRSAARCGVTRRGADGLARLSDSQVSRETKMLSSAAWAVFFRGVLDTAERFDTFVHYCRCGHDLGRERPPLFQECH